MPNSDSPRSRQARQFNAYRHRKQVIADGGRYLTVLLSPEANAALERLTERATITDAVERALISAAKKQDDINGVCE